ncbi:MAG TPA: thioesterase family protein [Verrucomicrobiales bacterium]|nr:thioesterase family protein [Verrucomicrobiales bacterium]
MMNREPGERRGVPVFEWKMRVPFADTDLAGIVHFSNFFRYMENAEHAFYRSLGLSVHPGGSGPEPAVAWPRVRAACDYRKPLRFEQELTIEIRLHELRRRSIRYGFVFRLPDDPEAIAEGEVAVVCVGLRPEGGIHGAVEIPALWRSRIEAAAGD